MQFKQLSEHALFVQFGETIHEQTQQQITAAVARLKTQPFPGLIEVMPSYTTICIFYDPFTVQKQLPPAPTIAARVQRYVTQLLASSTHNTETKRRIIEIPVWYGGEYGPDLETVARYHSLSEQDVITLHTARDYTVHMLGFAPGFPFLGGLDEKLATPRRNTPRLSIPAGSVGIGGQQTGIYPFATPGGWHIIGRTNVELFSLQHEPPTLLQPGDIVRFIEQRRINHAKGH